MIHAAHKRKTDSDDVLYEAQCGEEVGSSNVVSPVILLKFSEVVSGENNKKALCYSCLRILEGSGILAPPY